jgi:hypothetical protein
MPVGSPTIGSFQYIPLQSTLSKFFLQSEPSQLDKSRLRQLVNILGQSTLGKAIGGYMQ